jgi:hypothetical protein
MGSPISTEVVTLKIAERSQRIRPTLSKAPFPIALNSGFHAGSKRSHS